MIDLVADVVTILVLGSSVLFAIVTAARAAWTRVEPMLTRRVTRSALGIVLWISAVISIGALAVRATTSVTTVQDLEQRLKNAEERLGSIADNIMTHAHPPDYDSGWFDIARNCRVYPKHIGFMGLPKQMTAYYKIVGDSNQDEFILPWGLNQYGDANQSNGVVVDFNNTGNMYVRLPCGTRGANVIHLGRYRARDDRSDVEYFDLENVQFRVFLWK